VTAERIQVAKNEIAVEYLFDHRRLLR